MPRRWLHSRIEMQPVQDICSLDACFVLGGPSEDAVLRSEHQEQVRLRQNRPIAVLYRSILYHFRLQGNLFGHFGSHDYQPLSRLFRHPSR